MRTFAQLTGRVAGLSQDALQAEADRALYSVLHAEAVYPLRIVVGYHGFASEYSFRMALAKLLEDRVLNEQNAGYGPTSFPSLIICGNYSLVKLSGQPYVTPFSNGKWPMYGSTAANPLWVLLELLWTRLDARYGIGGLWGDESEVEVFKRFLDAEFVKRGGQGGWNYYLAQSTKQELVEIPTEKEWEPFFLTESEYALISLVCDGVEVRHNSEWKQFFAEQGLDLYAACQVLQTHGLLALAGDVDSVLGMTTQRCARVALPDGRLAAAEDGTGQLTRWVMRQYGEYTTLDAPSSSSSEQ